MIYEVDWLSDQPRLLYTTRGPDFTRTLFVIIQLYNSLVPPVRRMAGRTSAVTHLRKRCAWLPGVVAARLRRMIVYKPDSETM